MFLQLCYFFYAPESKFFEQHFYLFEHTKGSVKVCLTLEADVISDKICWLRYLKDITGFKDLNIKVSSGMEWNYQWVSGKAGHQPGLCVDHLLGKGWDEKLASASSPLAMYLPAIQPSVGNLSGQPYCYGEGDTQPRTDCWSKTQTEDCRPADVHQF